MKIRSAVVVLAAALTLVACGGDDQASVNETEETSDGREAFSAEEQDFLEGSDLIDALRDVSDGDRVRLGQAYCSLLGEYGNTGETVLVYPEEAAVYDVTFTQPDLALMAVNSVNTMCADLADIVEFGDEDRAAFLDAIDSVESLGYEKSLIIAFGEARCEDLAFDEYSKEEAVANLVEASELTKGQAQQITDSAVEHLCDSPYL